MEPAGGAEKRVRLCAEADLSIAAAVAFAVAIVSGLAHEFSKPINIDSPRGTFQLVYRKCAGQ